MTDRPVPSRQVARLADDFLARYRRGELPTIAEYSKAHPDHASQIEDLFPAIVMLERYRRLESANRKTSGSIESL